MKTFEARFGQYYEVKVRDTVYRMPASFYELPLDTDAVVKRGTDTPGIDTDLMLDAIAEILGLGRLNRMTVKEGYFIVASDQPARVRALCRSQEGAKSLQRDLTLEEWG